MRSRTTPRFWSAYRELPPEIKELARKAYGLFHANPRHPSLQFKKVHIVIYPSALTRVFARAGLDLLGELKRPGTTAGMLPGMLTHGELWELIGREQWAGLERRFVRDVKPGEEA